MFRRALLLLATLAACDGGRPTVVPPPTTVRTPPPTTVPPAPATLADLSANVTSPQAGNDLNCDADVRVRVAVNSRAATSVGVQGVLKRTAIIAGPCTPGGGDFVYRPLRQLIQPNGTTVVLDQSLYTGGVGCCDGRGCAGACRMLQTFEVITDLGHVPAGDFSYQVFYQNCPSCSRVSATTAAECPPPVALR